MRKSSSVTSLIKSIKAKANAIKTEQYIWEQQNQEYMTEWKAKQAAEQSEKLEKNAMTVFNHYLASTGCEETAAKKKADYIKQNKTNPF